MNNNGEPRLVFDPKLKLPTQFALLCGSFNPLHSGHLSMAESFMSQFHLPVFAEIAANNADKGWISEDELNQRLGQFTSDSLFSGVLVTLFPTFFEKTSFILSFSQWKPLLLVMTPPFESLIPSTISLPQK
ncbi:hypothetical protein P9112_010374 [Eukaryota sp. TZLM1-RC]